MFRAPALATTAAGRVFNGWARAIQRQTFTTFFGIAGQATQGAVLGAWVVLAVSRTWRPRPDDPGDRLGRRCGWGWLALYAFGILYLVIWT